MPKGKKKPLTSEQRKAIEKSKPRELIGTVVLVNTEANFVLIDNQSRPSPSVAVTVQGRSADGSTSELRITEIRKRPFIIADVVSGAPQKGDTVFQ